MDGEHVWVTSSRRSSRRRTFSGADSYPSETPGYAIHQMTRERTTVRGRFDPRSQCPPRSEGRTGGPCGTGPVLCLCS